MKKLLLLIVVSFFASARAQNPDSVTKVRDSVNVTAPISSQVYHVNRWVTGGILVAGGVAGFAATPAINTKPVISQEEMLALNRETINGFDSWALQQNSTNLDVLERYADWTMIFAAIAPLTLVFDERIRYDWLDVFMLYLEMHAVNGMLYFDTPLGPLFQNKYRPIVYHDELSYDKRKSGNNRNSFYSGHVAFVAGATFFMAKVYCDYHPEMEFGTYIAYAAAAIPPLALSYFRLRSLDHFPSDIITGFGIGLLTGILVPQLHHIANTDLSLNVYPLPSGIGMSMQLGLK